MEAILIYLLKVNVVTSLLYAIYCLFLKKERAFQLNRLYLIGALVISFIIPVTPSIKQYINYSSGKISTQDQTDPYRNPSTGFSAVKGFGINFNPDFTTDPHNKQLQSGFSYQEMMVVIYLCICAILLIRLICMLVSLVLLLRSSTREKQEGIILCTFKNQVPPFSFFHYLMINKNSCTQQEYCNILAHEKVHIHQWHSLDILLVELIHALHWYNPLMVLLKQSLKVNLEFIADQQALNSGIDKKHYQTTLIQYLLSSKQPYLTNLFNSPKIKQRILMMNAALNPKINLYKFCLIVPALLLSNFLLGSFSKKDKKQSSTTLNKIDGNYGSIYSGSLSTIEGYYEFQFTKGKSSYIQILQSNGKVVLKELFSGIVTEFEQKSELVFYNRIRDFDLKFIKNKQGIITSMLAFNQDLWSRLPEQPSVKKAVQLTPIQMSNLQGNYHSEHNPDVAINIEFAGSKLIWKTLWNGAQTEYSAESESRFFIPQANIKNDIEFIKDAVGHIVSVKQTDGPTWIKTNRYTPPIEKYFPLEDLKRLEGKYISTDKRFEGSYQISLSNYKLVFTHLDKNNCKQYFYAITPAKFFCEIDLVTMYFTEDAEGMITQFHTNHLFGSNKVYTKVN